MSFSKKGVARAVETAIAEDRLTFTACGKLGTASITCWIIGLTGSSTSCSTGSGGLDSGSRIIGAAGGSGSLLLGGTTFGACTSGSKSKGSNAGISMIGVPISSVTGGALGTDGGSVSHVRTSGN